MSKLLFQVSDNSINKSDYVNIEEAIKKRNGLLITDIYNWDRLYGISELLCLDNFFDDTNNGGN